MWSSDQQLWLYLVSRYWPWDLLQPRDDHTEMIVSHRANTGKYPAIENTLSPAIILKGFRSSVYISTNSFLMMQLKTLSTASNIPDQHYKYNKRKYLQVSWRLKYLLIMLLNYGVRCEKKPFSFATLLILCEDKISLPKQDQNWITLKARALVIKNILWIIFQWINCLCVEDGCINELASDFWRQVYIYYSNILEKILFKILKYFVSLASKVHCTWSSDLVLIVDELYWWVVLNILVEMLGLVWVNLSCYQINYHLHSLTSHTTKLFPDNNQPKIFQILTAGRQVSPWHLVVVSLTRLAFSG